jgi:radical SAM enzyme (TIGR01210 family)
MGVGTEITLILRSKACTWAHSKSGGCSMCGYWNDRADESISGENYWNQFLNAIQRSKEILTDPDKKIAFKIFSSGSFCDSQELPTKIQNRILQKLYEYYSIKEIVIESRPEYISNELLKTYKPLIHDKYLEFGIGLESQSDYIRTNLINKGFSKHLFLEKVRLLHKFNFGVKAYILFKPPFLNEYSALVDCYETIQFCKDNQIDTISINPTNIQNHTICEELHKRNNYRTPWLYSLLFLLKNSLQQNDLQTMRVICDPSAKGKERGVHNCEPHDPSNTKCLNILEKFIKSQDLSHIPTTFSGDCYEDYLIQLYHGRM